MCISADVPIDLDPGIENKGKVRFCLCMWSLFLFSTRCGPWVNEICTIDVSRIVEYMYTSFMVTGSPLFQFFTIEMFVKIADVGIVHVNPRFHTTDAVCNLGLTWKPLE